MGEWVSFGQIPGVSGSRKHLFQQLPDRRNTCLYFVPHSRADFLAQFLIPVFSNSNVGNFQNQQSLHRVFGMFSAMKNCSNRRLKID
jgi:hypothetical protein